MKKIRSGFSLLICALIMAACSEKQPQADHVIILGFDAMSSLGIQRAETPNFDSLVENGALSLHTRCIRETSSSQNWMSMVSAAPSEMHTVYSNAWKKGDERNVPPALMNKEGLFPTVFDMIREQKPELKQYAFVEWTSEMRMYDCSVFDSCCVAGMDPDLKNADDVINKAFDCYLKDRPEVLFLSIDLTDHMGHTYGHESDEYLNCITHFDSVVGEFVKELETRGWMKNTVIIITADHGGIRFGHGGDTLAEYEVPVIMYGKGVTRGKIMKNTNMIYDIGATVAGLLGVELPWECRGKLLKEAFEPADGSTYVAIPFVRPFDGKVTDSITISSSTSGSSVYYTLDGSAPDTSSTLYTGPFTIERACKIRSVAYKNGTFSATAENWLTPKGTETPVRYRLYKNVMDSSMPDFTKFGLPTATGCVNCISLEDLGLANEDHFAVQFTSNLIIPSDGEYRFGLQSDDGAIIYIDGKAVVENSAAHNMKPKTGQVKLTRGKHIIKVDFWEHSKVQGLEIKFSKSGESLRPLLCSDLEN